MDVLSPLYHYTNVGILALILKNHSIRFNSLDRMDDRQEQMTADLKKAGQFCYVSAWTDDDEESIPMWNMYTPLEAGVRISLRRNPFRIYTNSTEIMRGATGCRAQIEPENGIESIIPLSDMINNSFLLGQATSKDILWEVKYTNDYSKLNPKIIGDNEETTVVRLMQLGRYKNTHWKFQREWRYIIHAIPFDWNGSDDMTSGQFAEFCSKLYSDTGNQPFPHYDMIIDKEAFEEMTITLSPCLSAGNRVIVQDLVEKYNPKAKILESKLNGLL